MGAQRQPSQGGACYKPEVMVYLYCTYGVPMVYLWCAYGVRMVYVWCTYGVPMVYVWCTQRGGWGVVAKGQLWPVARLEAARDGGVRNRWGAQPGHGAGALAGALGMRQGRGCSPP